MTHLCTICLGTNCPNVSNVDASHAPHDTRKRLEAIEEEWAETKLFVLDEIGHPNSGQDRAGLLRRWHEMVDWLPLVEAVLEEMRLEDA